MDGDFFAEEFAHVHQSGPEDTGMRIDVFVSSKEGISRSAAARLIEEGEVLLNGLPCAKNARISAGDTVSVTLPEPEDIEAQPEDIPLDIVYEDDDIIVINKPVGMVVHPAPGNPDGTLVNALLFHCRGSLSGIGGKIRPGIVHRIDKDTAGLIVAAKNDAAHAGLAAGLKTHEIKRIYYTVAIGNIKADSGTIDAPVGRHPTDRKRMAVIRDPEKKSREAVTHYEVLERFGRFTHMRCRLETGRTHQIRVHFSYIGHPLLGDPLYGGDGTAFQARNRSIIQGQTLFAGELEFIHPTKMETMRFTADFPENYRKIIENLRKEIW